jgi:hypothetical protein
MAEVAAVRCDAMRLKNNSHVVLFAFAHTTVQQQGVGCARGYPGVYSRISGAYDWIQEQICTLSQNPPPHCGGKTTSNNLSGDIRIRIDIRHDDYPADTGWQLRGDKSKTVVTRSEIGSVKKERTLVSTFVDLQPGTYRFRIDDDYGDGLTVGNEGMYM